VDLDVNIPELGILARLPLFRNTDPAVIADLMPQFSCRELAAGDVLFRPGQLNNTLFVLLSGQLQVHLEADEAAPTVELEPGETVGEISILDGQPVSALVTAETPARLLAIDRQIVWALVERSGSLARNLLYLLSGRLRRNNELIMATYRHNRDLQDKAFRDALTGLLNRRGLETALERLVVQSRSDSSKLSLLMIDVDKFKNLNDTHGHAAGDRLLASLGDSIRASLRPEDLAARYGGDEIVVGLAGAAVRQARVVAERIRSTCHRLEIRDENGRIIPTPTLSIGLAELVPGQSAQDLFQAADEALYRAKSKGRDRVAA